MSDGAKSGEPKVLRLRRDDTCRSCAAPLPAGTRASWDPRDRTTTCLGCLASVAPAAIPDPDRAPAPLASDAGSSAQREHDRRHEQREQRVRERHPRLGGLLLAVSSDPTSTQVWARGAEGERRVGALLDRAAGANLAVLHDRRVPRSKANLDHLAITPTGVWVIDTKRYQGRVEKRPSGSLLRPGPNQLFVAGRNRTNLVTAMTRQVDVVRSHLPDPAIPVRPALCFIDADWGLLGRPFSLDGVTITHPKALLTALAERGPFDPTTIAATAAHLAHRLRPA